MEYTDTIILSHKTETWLEKYQHTIINQSNIKQNVINYSKKYTYILVYLTFETVKYFPSWMDYVPILSEKSVLILKNAIYIKSTVALKIVNHLFNLKRFLISEGIDYEDKSNINHPFDHETSILGNTSNYEDGKRYLVLYMGHDNDFNTKMFIKRGIIDRPNTDYILCFNNPQLQVDISSRPNIFDLKHSDVCIVNRENVGYDFGGWSEILLSYPRENVNLKVDGKIKKSSALFDAKGNEILKSRDLVSYYDFFVFVNSSIRGPFMPKYSSMDWITLLSSQLTEGRVDLAGGSINCDDTGIYKDIPHIQSMLFVLNKEGINFMIKKGIFSLEMINDKHDVIREKEEGQSFHMLQNNRRIVALHDMRIERINCYDKRYNIHPYDVIFIKTSPWTYFIHEKIDMYTSLLMGEKT